MTKKKSIDTSVFEFDDDTPETEWRGMPEYNQPFNGAHRQLIINFDSDEGVKEFSKLVSQQITDKTKSIWYPPRERNNVVDLFWFENKTNKDQS